MYSQVPETSVSGAVHVFSVATYHVAGEKAPVIVKFCPVTGAAGGSRMQPGGWPSPFGVQSFVVFYSYEKEM